MQAPGSAGGTAALAAAKVADAAAGEALEAGAGAAQRGGGAADAADADAPLPGPAPPSPELDAALVKNTWRVVVPFTAVALMNHLDRSNLAFAALTLNRDNNFTPQIYSLGTSLFFVSFCIFQVPANIVMIRVGFKPWLSFLLVAWGIVASCFSLINSVWSFYLLRVLLGIFEAGAFPAMWYALSTFFPRRSLTKPYAYLTMGIMGANMIGAPLGFGLLSMDGIGGLKGWQWLFLLEGIPSVLLGIALYIWLPSNIAAAKYLTPGEAATLEEAVARDYLPGAFEHDWRTVRQLVKMVLDNRYFWLIFTSGTLMSIAAATYTAFTPIIIANLMAGTALTNQATVAASKGSRDLRPVALTFVPYFLAVVLSYVVAHSSQRRNEIFFHITSCLVFAGVLMALFAPLAQANVIAGFLALSISLAVSFASNGPGMVLIARLCKGREQVVAQPMSNTFNVSGGIVGPLVTAALMNTLGGFKYVAVLMGVLMVVTSMLLLVLRWWVNRDGGLPDAGVGRRYSELAAASRSGGSADAKGAGGLELVGGGSKATNGASK